MPNVIGSLHVVLHGLITLVKRKDGLFHGYFIEMNDHKYLAGSWLNELSILPADVLTLEGVVRGSDDVKRAENLVVPVKGDLKARIVGLREVILPPPRRLHSVFTTNIHDQLSDATVPSSTNLSAVLVFEYDLTSLAGVKLVSAKYRDEIWIPGTLRSVSSTGQAAAVLHLFNEPANRPANDGHYADEFRKSFQLLGYRLTIKSTIEISAKERAKQKLTCFGLKRLELHDLVAREAVVSWIARHMVDPEVPQPAATSIGSEPAVCGGGSGFEV